MVELTAKNACAGLLPLQIGDALLKEIDVGPLTSVSPFGDTGALSQALEVAHGLGWPAPCSSTAKDGVRCLWFGRNEALLMGAAPDPTLAAHAAVVDQSDAWAVTRLGGSAAVDVLARLVPVDLRDTAFQTGDSIRTQLFHMNASITKIGEGAFMILVFRSMAVTLVHDLKGAMQAVAARG